MEMFPSEGLASGSLFCEDRVLGVAARLKVGDEVQHLVLVEGIQETRRHQGNGVRLASLDLCQLYRVKTRATWEEFESI